MLCAGTPYLVVGLDAFKIGTPRTKSSGVLEAWPVQGIGANVSGVNQVTRRIDSGADRWLQCGSTYLFLGSIAQGHLVNLLCLPYDRFTAAIIL